jgi:hypothetical protein
VANHNASVARAPAAANATNPKDNIETRIPQQYKKQWENQEEDGGAGAGVSSRAVQVHCIAFRNRHERRAREMHCDNGHQGQR